MSDYQNMGSDLDAQYGKFTNRMADKAWDDGVKARLDGVRREDNPYQTGPNKDVWTGGYDSQSVSDQPSNDDNNTNIGLCIFVGGFLLLIAVGSAYAVWHINIPM